MQTVNLNAGSYMLSFQAAQRPCCSSSYLQPIRVTVDGADVGARVRPPSTDFTGFSVSFEILTSGPHTIGFTGTEPNDKSTFIDAKNWNEAIRVYEKALAQFPNDGTLKNNLEYCKEQKKK